MKTTGEGESKVKKKKVWDIDAKTAIVDHFKSSGMSRAEFARQVGVSPGTLWNWLHPERLLAAQKKFRQKKKRSKLKLVSQPKTVPKNKSAPVESVLARRVRLLEKILKDKLLEIELLKLGNKIGGV